MINIYAIISTTLIISFFLLSDLHATHRFGYRRPDQRRWSKQYGHCAGKMQSPISINCGKAIPIIMPTIELIGYRNLLPIPLKILNNGHTVVLHIPRLTNESIEMGDFLPWIMGGKLEGQYEIESIHFHWGDKNNRGSEHMINDIRYTMEMHIVHRNKKYMLLKEALGYSDGVAVLAFFFSVNEHDSDELYNIVKYLHLIPNIDDYIYMNSTFSLSSLIDGINLERFYMYRGSLTTPPCSEAVTWIVFPDPLRISTAQISRFRHLRGTRDGSVLVDNYRALQPLGNRRIFLRKVNSKSTLNSLIENNDIHFSKWEWFY